MKQGNADESDGLRLWQLNGGGGLELEHRLARVAVRALRNARGATVLAVNVRPARGVRIVQTRTRRQVIVCAANAAALADKAPASGEAGR